MEQKQSTELTFHFLTFTNGQSHLPSVKAPNLSDSLRLSRQRCFANAMQILQGTKLIQSKPKYVWIYLFLSFRRRFRSLLLLSHFSTRIAPARVCVWLSACVYGGGVDAQFLFLFILYFSPPSLSIRMQVSRDNDFPWINFFSAFRYCFVTH